MRNRIIRQKVISIILSLTMLIRIGPISANAQETGAETFKEVIQTVSANDQISVLTGHEEAEEADEPGNIIQKEYKITKEQQDAWQKDGTWESRITFMQELEDARYYVPKELDIVKSSGADGNDLYQWRNTYASTPSTGNVRVLYFLVDFQDMSNINSNYTAQNIENHLFSNNGRWSMENGYFNGSITDYYKTSSFQKLTIDGDVYGWYTAVGNREDYSDRVSGRERLLREVLTYYDDQIDYSQYDADGDGYIDAIYINYAGEMGDWGEQWWSYATNWYGADGDLKLDGITPRGYVFSGEKCYQDGSEARTRYNAVMIHETGHLLGLPDYYDYDMVIGEGGGLGGADIMDANIGDHNPFSKLMLGWIDSSMIRIADMNSDFIEYKLNQSWNSGEVLIVTADWNGSYCSEYYLLDYYTDNGLNQGVFDTQGGIRIWHVNAALDETGKGFANNNSYTTNKLLKLYEADGKEEISQTWWSTGVCVTDEDLYHTGDSLNYFTYPNSDYYGKKFTGIHIQIGKISDGKYTVLVKKDDQNSEEPQIVSVIPDTTQSGMIKNSVYDGRWLEITFNNTCSIVDESKLSIVTRSGTTAAMGAPVMVDKRLIFPIYGDSSTKAVIKIDPGFIANSSGIENSWSKSYEINTFIPLVSEGEALTSWQDTSLPEVRGTFVDGNGKQYALVNNFERKAYIVQFDKSGTNVRIDLGTDQEEIVNLSPPIMLDDDVFAIRYSGYTLGVGSVIDIGIFRTDGTLLDEYHSEYSVGYVSAFTNIYHMPDGSIVFYSNMGNEIHCYKLTYDADYKISVIKKKIGEYWNDSWQHNYLHQDGNRILIVSQAWRDGESDYEQQLCIWELTENNVTTKNVLVPKEPGYNSVSFSCSLEEEDSYVFFGTTSNVPEDGSIFGKIKAIAIRIAKNDLSVVDYMEFEENEYWVSAGGVLLNDVVKMNDDEYVLQFYGMIPEDMSQFFSNRPTRFMVCTDGSFNTRWVKVTKDEQSNALVKEQDGQLYAFTRINEKSIIEYHQLKGESKTTTSIIVENNLSEEKIIRQVVVGGQFRYLIPQIEGKEYQVFVDGIMTPVSSNVLVYLNTVSETGNHDIRIEYSNMGVDLIFDDIPKTQWYWAAVQFAYDNKIMQGKGNGKFDPAGSLTRAEFATTLYSMEGRPEVSYRDIFNDVPNGQWFSNPVLWANQANIASGYGGSIFGVSDTITREQLALMVYKFVTDVRGFEPDIDEGVLEKFKDNSEVSSWAVTAMEWAVTNGIISGTGENKLNPQGNALRCECAQILKKVYEYLDYEML